MCNLNTFETTDADIDNCLVEVDLCDNVLQCPCCCYFLEKKKQEIADTIIRKLKRIPEKVTRIKIPLYPLPDNKYYYSFDGVTTIVYNLLRTDNDKFKRHLENYKSVIKIYYEKSPLFNIPIIQIELLFFGELSRNAITEFWKVLKAEVLFFTGSIGNIEVLEIDGLYDLEELVKIPLLFGHPEFKHKGVLKELNFTIEQIKEMNYMHSFILQELVMSKTINNNNLDLFRFQREALEREEREKASVASAQEVIDAIFALPKDHSLNEPSEHEDNYMDLPF
jgi:hypothetical protein